MALVEYTNGERVESFKGCVLEIWEQNGYHDSDFYATVWNEELQKVQDVMYDTTRCGGSGSATVDVTTDVARKVYRYYKQQALLSVERHILCEKNKIGKGRVVIVHRGRKVPKGTVGKVFWTGAKYNAYARKMEDKVGIETTNGKEFLLAEYVKTIDGQKITLHPKERKRFIQRQALINCGAYVRGRLAH